MIEKLKELIVSFVPEDVIVEFDEAKMMNYKTLDIKDKRVVYIEEYRNGEYSDGYGFKREDSVSLYIYKSGTGKPIDAYNRELIRSKLEEEIIVPILKGLSGSVSNVRYNVSSSRFDTIETGITISFTYIEDICYANVY